MTPVKNILSLLFIATLAITVTACKAKKPLAQKPAPATQTAPPAATPTEEKKAEPAAEPTPPPAPPKPNYNFSNIQFEFNSGVLKTSAYPILDKAAAELKKDQSVRIALNGYASAEGTDEHNMALSQERANAVKTYLVNSGVNADMLTAKGYGESNPISNNTDEAGRAINRRVEIKKM